MGRVKNEHYVPQSYLRSFANKKEQIFVYDKVKKVSYINKVSQVASEGKYFDIPLHDGLNVPGIEQMNEEQTIEKYFSEDIEGPYKKYLDKIRTRYLMTFNPDGKVAITKEEKKHLSYLIAIQMLRTRKYREDVGAMESKFSQMLVDLIGEEEIPDYKSGDVTVNVPEVNKKLMQISMLLNPETISSFANELYKHCWSVLVNNTEQPFYTSDNPVVKYAHKEDQFLSYGGLASEGIEIALPLTSKLILIMRERSFHTPFLPVENEFAYLSAEEHVDFYNYLQVSQSNRQIYCLTNKFNLIEQIKKEQPEILEVHDNVEIHHNGKVY